MMKFIKYLFLALVIILCYFVAADIVHIGIVKKTPPEYETIIRPKEVTIVDLESKEYFYTECHVFDQLARWEENDYQVEEPENIQWKYKFYFKRGSRIVEVYLAKESYYKINDTCFKLNESCASDSLYVNIQNIIPYSVYGYDCSNSPWCTELHEGNQ